MELLQYLTNPWTRAIIVLIIFAGIDLMVGVSNDAVNFLNSAIGSKVASRKTIYRVAAAGILIGASFSGGMMEIARKGIFNPTMFSFYDIMIVFFSVVMADVILLDVYNTFKLPTSTTVSVVFELLGAGLAIALIHMVGDDLTISALGSFINASSTITIISGIFLSVAIAFVAGWIIQTIIKTVFSFDYQDDLKRRGWLLGGIAITAITYFLVIKGLKEAVIIPPSLISRIGSHTRSTVSILFIFWSIASVIFQQLFRRNILKVIVLVGTFALAAAFAGNDLVNFIGVSVAGYQAVVLYLASGLGDPTQLMMGGLADKVSTPTIFLFGSAIIMIYTLMTSKKAQSVTETEIGLTQHATGQETFKPGPISRWLVKKSIIAHRSISHIVPISRQTNIAGRFVQSPTHSHQADGPAFDLLRASINLTLSAVLIAIATNMKLPLSTTYVTFMVAMGTALADGARGRDSAVFRISGVLTIIGAWLMTAVIALTMTLILTSLLWNLGFWGVGVAVILVGYMLIRSHHRVTQPSSNEISESITDTSNLSDILLHQTVSILPSIQSTLSLVIAGIMHDDDDLLTESYRQARTISTSTKQIKLNIHTIFEQLGTELIHTGHTYVQGVEVLRKATLSIETMAEQCQEYVLNKHPDLISTQIDELNLLKSQINILLQEAIMIIEHNDFGLIPAFDIIATKLIDQLDVLKQSQFARIKAGETGIRNTTLYITILTELYTVVINIQKLVHYIRRVS